MEQSRSPPTAGLGRQLPPPAGRPRRGWGGVGGVGGVRQLSPGPASQGPNELAASWAPATADTALVSAETKPLTEKLPPSATGVVATSNRLAHSCAPAGVESVVNATSCSVARSWASPPVVSRLNASTSPASRASVSASSHQVR
jgi:hypothetical protein